ncbi:glycosyltransferase [Vibrio ponticus]|uniref:glycosyltransferase n=1 Tax=Vibrio ponticus TaxID=265668 RepID=UPI00138683AA|nr:glycosyltransferase [Vibrio ponticus]
MNEKVSIIIPLYNGSSFIAKTIDSCLNQTYRNIEVILIDDCSTDKSRETIKPYEGQVKIIYNEVNCGISKSVNKAMSLASGEFFILLGHDDILPSRHVELMLHEFEIDVVSVHCNSIYIDMDDKHGLMKKSDDIQFEKTLNCAFELSIDNFINSCGMIHRTSLFNRVGGWDESYRNYGEWLFYIKSLEFGRIKYTDVSRSLYRRHGNNITNSFSNKEVIKSLNDYKFHCRRLAYLRVVPSFFEKIKYAKSLSVEKIKYLYYLLK